MLEAYLLAFFFLLGLLVGSFVNVAILRFGFTERPASRSHCAACNAQIHWYDLVPVLSFFLLSGKCRSCGSALAVQYPLVEFATGALFALVYFAYPPVSPFSFMSFIALLVFCATLVALVAYDIRHTLIPLPFVYLLGAAALFARAGDALSLLSAAPLLDALTGAVALGGFFAFVHFVTRGRGMGIGDAYVAAPIGLLLGLVRGASAMVLGIWAATIYYLVLLIFSRLLPRNRWRQGTKPLTMKSELPFAPFLALGSALALFTPLSPFAIGEWLARFL